jgi:Uma2 family endonuclease
MSAVPKTKLTAAEYLAVEDAAAFKSEFYRGEMFAMAGASWAHNTIKENLSIELGGRLKGGPCRTYSADMRVKVSRTGLYTYPDVLIVCGPPEIESVKGVETLLNPQVVIEILSESTERYDRGTKFAQYQQLPAVREYVLVGQEERRVERFVRQPDETWVLTTFADPAGEFALATVPVRVPLADVYRGVELPPGPTGPPAAATT